MKYNMLILALGLALAAVAVGCPQQDDGNAPAGAAADAGTAQPAPPAATGAGTDAAGEPAQPPAATGAAGITDQALVLDGVQLGMPVAEVKALVPASWKPTEQWAPEAKELSGIINYVAPMEPPKKGVVIPPEIASYAFYEGKLIGLSHTVPVSAAETFDAWVAEATGKYGPAGGVLPDFAQACDFLIVIRNCPPTDKLVAWDNAEQKHVLAGQFSPASKLAAYYLADTFSYTKLQAAMMAQPVDAAPAPPAGS